MSTVTQRYLHNIKTDRKVIAVCEIIHHYSIIDNSVNDSSSMGEYRIPVTLRISNVPPLPPVSSTTGLSSSFTVPVMLDFSLDERDIKKAIGITGKVDIDGDGTNYYINKRSNGCPLYDVRVERYDEVGEND